MNSTFNGNTQIVDLYESSGLSIESIAQALSYDILAVKAILSQFSTKFRQECAGQKVEEDSDWSNDEQKEARQILINIARNSDDDNLRASCAKAIVRDKREGQKIKSTNSLLGSATLNITLIQQQIEAGRKALKVVEGAQAPQEIPSKELKMLEEARSKK